MTLEQKIAIALPITARFEGSGFGQVTGNFDGMGLSAGALQWCVGQGSLQRAILKPFVVKHGRLDRLYIFPKSVDKLLTMSSKDAVAFCQNVMHKPGSTKVLKPEWKLAWQKFMSLPTVIELQLAAAYQIGVEAEKQCKAFGLTSLRGFCWAFDIEVQNGSMEGIGLALPDRLEALKVIHGRADVKVKSLWLERLPSLSDEQVSLFLTGYRRALSANPKWFQAVFNRKAAIAIGKGFVNGVIMDIDKSLANYTPESQSTIKPAA